MSCQEPSNLQRHLPAASVVLVMDQNNPETPFFSDDPATLDDATSSEIGDSRRSCFASCKSFITTKYRYLRYSSITFLDLFFVSISLIFYIFDMSSDILVARSHRQKGNTWWMKLTITFIFMPYLLGFLSTVPKTVKELRGAATVPDHQKRPCWKVLGELAAFSIPGLHLYWYIKAVYAAYQAWRYNYPRYHFEAMNDLTFISLIDIFAQDTLQLVLQIYIFLKDPNAIESIQWLSIALSLLALSWGITSSYKANCRAEREVKITYSAVLLCFLWHLFTIWPRALALAICSYYMLIFLGSIVSVHFFLSCIFFLCYYPNTSVNLHLLIVSFISSYMTLISSYTPRYRRLMYYVIETPARVQHLVLHTLIYIENVCILVVCDRSPAYMPMWFSKLAYFSIVFGYIVGIACQIGYYCFKHHRNHQEDLELQIAICIPWKDWIRLKERRSGIEGRVVRRWIKEIRARTELITEAEIKKHEDEIKRQENMMRRFSYCPKEDKEAWMKEISREEGRIARRWTQTIKKWRNGANTEEEIRKQEKGLVRQEELMKSFRFCPEEDNKVWKEDISREETRIISRWTNSIKRWGEGEKTKEETKRQEEEIERQEKLAIRFFNCPTEEREQWEKEISKEERRVIRRWTDGIKSWAGRVRKNKDIRRLNEVIQKQEKMIIHFINCPEEERKYWRKEISKRDNERTMVEGEIIRQWIKEIKGWGEARTDKEIREQGEEIERQEKIMRRFHYCPEEERGEWEEEISKQEQNIIRRWTEEMRNRKTRITSEEEIYKMEKEIERQEIIMRSFHNCPKKEGQELEKELSRVKEMIIRRSTEDIRGSNERVMTEEGVKIQKAEIKRQKVMMEISPDCPKKKGEPREDITARIEGELTRRHLEEIKRLSETAFTREELERLEEEISNRGDTIRSFRHYPEARHKWEAGTSGIEATAKEQK